MNFLYRIIDGFRWLFRVIGTAAVRFYWDDCFSRASSLAYTTLFALVPVSALSFSMLNAFRIDKDQLVRTLSSILQQVLPPMENELMKDLREQIFDYIQLFNDNVSALNSLSIAVLFLTAIALLNTIESAMNVVWRASSNLTVAGKIISFWAVITLGPLLIAASFYWWARVGALASTEPWVENKVIRVVDFLIPVMCTWLALTLLFYRLPAAIVRFSDAAFGALLAAVIFELVKRGFARYISFSTTYSTIYGVLTSIPVFLFWLYCAWAVVLFGAEVSYQAGNIRLFQGLRKYKTDLGEMEGIFGLRILYCITRNFLLGHSPPSESDLAVETGADPARVKSCLDILSQANILTAPDNKTHARALRLAPDKFTIGYVLDTFCAEEYRQSKKRGPETNEAQSAGVFLEFLRQTSLREAADEPIESWTLAQLVHSELSCSASS